MVSRLGLTLALLVVLLGALSLAQRRPDFWPLNPWAVYSDIRPAVPGATSSVLEVRAWNRRGAMYRLRQEHLVEYSRHRIAVLALARARDDAATRSYLTRLVRRAVGEDVERLEVWEITWAVDVLAVPPLDRDRPLAERQLASLVAAGASGAP